MKTQGLVAILRVPKKRYGKKQLKNINSALIQQMSELVRSYLHTSDSIGKTIAEDIENEKQFKLYIELKEVDNV